MTEKSPTKTELATELEELKARVGELEAERDEHLATLQRVAADFDNYRKRAQRGPESRAALAGERLVKELLPVLDDLERALEAAGAHEEAKLEEGVGLVARAVKGAVERGGVSVVATDGQFDPHRHEALLSQPSDADEGFVIQVLHKGYSLGDKVLRPARVVVAAPKGPKA